MIKLCRKKITSGIQVTGIHVHISFEIIHLYNLIYWTGGEFGTLKELVDALKEESTDAILIDMYTPVRRKDLFNGSWFEISEIVDKGISHGIALGGISETLAKDFQEMIRDRNVQTKFLTDDDENHQQVIRNCNMTGLYYDR